MGVGYRVWALLWMNAEKVQLYHVTCQKYEGIIDHLLWNMWILKKKQCHFSNSKLPHQVAVCSCLLSLRSQPMKGRRFLAAFLQPYCWLPACLCIRSILKCRGRHQRVKIKNNSCYILSKRSEVLPYRYLMTTTCLFISLVFYAFLKNIFYDGCWRTVLDAEIGYKLKYKIWHNTDFG